MLNISNGSGLNPVPCVVIKEVGKVNLITWEMVRILVEGMIIARFPFAPNATFWCMVVQKLTGKN